VKADSKVAMYTDGACSGNPGPGGYAAVVVHSEWRKEVEGGYSPTTNNRMEMMAVIAGLEGLKTSCIVTVTSDSTYVVNAMTKGWARGWRQNGWRLGGGKGRPGKGDTAKNVDLWRRLLELCDTHEVRFKWVRGHTGHPENERADILAVAQTRRTDLPIDEGYEAGRSLTQH